jgi:MFS family permease
MTRRAARASMPSLEGVSGDASRPHSAEFLESLTMQKRGEIRWSPLWHNRDYLLFQGGDIISGIGDSVQYLALSLLVLSLTGSPPQAGIVLGLSAIASMVFGLFAGALADRWDRKKIMIWCDIGQMTLVGTIPVALWLGKLAMPQIYIVTGATSAFSTFFGAAATSALPNVTGPAQLIDGLRQGQAAGEVIRISGGVIGGSLFAIARAMPFATNALSFGVSAVTLRLIRTDFRESPDEGAAESAQDLWHDITAGLRWLWNHKLVRLVTLVTSADSLRYGAGYLVIVLLAKRLHTPAAGIGGIFAAAGVGALMGNVVAGWAEKRFTFGTVTLSMLWVEAIVFPLLRSKNSYRRSMSLCSGITACWPSRTRCGGELGVPCKSPPTAPSPWARLPADSSSSGSALCRHRRAGMANRKACHQRTSVTNFRILEVAAAATLHVTSVSRITRRPTGPPSG